MSPPRMLVLCEDDEVLESAFPGFEITEYGEKGWKNGKTYFFSVSGHPSQVVQQFAKWLEKSCPEPNDSTHVPPTLQDIEAALKALQD